MMHEAIEIKVKDVQIGIANVHARLPFRFGKTTIRHVSQATVEVTIQTRDGRIEKGYAADFLSYAWFDKTPGKSPAVGSRELLDSIQRAGEAWTNAGFSTAFGLWRDLHPDLETASLAQGHNRLGGNFGVSMIERGVIDAIGRLTGQGFHDLIRSQILDIDEASVFAELTPGSLVAALPKSPLAKIQLRHTVGLVDPLTAADNVEPMNDGLPETLEDYLKVQGLRSLKIKISSDTDETMDRLEKIAGLLRAVERPVLLTLDGNEQFTDVDSFAAMADLIRHAPALGALWQSVLFIEQPVERTVTLSAPLTSANQQAIGKPMIIDESDGWTTAFSEAIDLGYRGVSHKNCKGVFRSFLNNALAAKRNSDLDEARYFLSAEDLSCLPIVSLNADLAAASSLGIGHIERNGHHYFRRLEHLSVPEQDSAADYGGLYHRTEGRWSLAVSNGMLDTSTLNYPGFGLCNPPDMDRLATPETWSFDA